METSLVIRLDDAGSNDSTNRAIADICAANKGVNLNVSLMANGFAIESAVDLLAHYHNCCFGVHLTLNAEWDRVRWGPISHPSAVTSLVDGHGFLYRSPQMFAAQQVKLDEVFLEMDHQLAKLRKLGFNIAYADEHMVFGDGLIGFKARFAGWCQRNQLINWRQFNRRLPALDYNHESNSLTDQLVARLEAAGPAIYTVVTHPAYDSDEMQKLGDANHSGAFISQSRNRDRMLLQGRQFHQYCLARGIRWLRYDECQ